MKHYLSISWWQFEDHHDISEGMKIMGIDPGYQRMGWAILENNKGQNKTLAYGCVETQRNKSAEIRLSEIYQKLNQLIKKHQPEAMSVEELFFAANAKTAIGVGQARGVILLAAAQNNVPVVSYTPLVVKETICGSGSADKTQVQKMVARLLKLTKIPSPDDAADALAIALTHAYSYKLKGKII